MLHRLGNFEDYCRRCLWLSIALSPASNRLDKTQQSCDLLGVCCSRNRCCHHWEVLLHFLVECSDQVLMTIAHGGKILLVLNNKCFCLEIQEREWYSWVELEFYDNVVFVFQLLLQATAYFCGQSSLLLVPGFWMLLIFVINDSR